MSDEALEMIEPESGQVPAPKRRRGVRLTPRQAFGGLAVVLSLILVGLLVYILFYLGGQGFLQKGGSTQSGIRPVLTINGPGRGAYPNFSRPMGVAFGEGGRIYVSDTGNNRVVVFDRKGRYLFEFGGFGVAKPLPGGKYSWTPGRMNYPVGIDVGEDGNVYVADFRNDQVEVFDADGKFLKAFPDNKKPVGKGSSGQDGTGIAVTDVFQRAGKVYATDQYQVFVFSTDGRLLQQFGKPGSGKADIDHPNGISANGEDRIYVSDSNHNRVTAFDLDGQAVWNVGELPKGGSMEASGTLGLPRGIAVDDRGDILVVDAFNFEIVRISPGGKVLGRYGERGVEPGQLNFPNDVDSQDSLLLVADKENNRVQVLELVAR